ncbi:DUF2291 family protein [Rhodopirellula bahusiensis]|uniref:DUF2291 family protein n=1 Tax=Rhodopirellula bahusiensis TaxID=2014065 RepID=UPI003265F1E5
MISRQKIWISRFAVAIGILVLLYLFPLFRVVSLDDANEASAKASAAKFDPIVFVDQFWNDKLLASKANAVDALELVNEIQANPGKVRQARGRQVGLSQSYFLTVTGVGRVVSVEKNSVGLAITDQSDEAEVVLESGILFGNTVRDGTGLLDVNEFQNTQDFNAISTELNRRIEANVLPTLRDIATSGTEIEFAGCAQVSDESTDLNPLRVVPFFVEAK